MITDLDGIRTANADWDRVMKDAELNYEVLTQTYSELKIYYIKMATFILMLFTQTRMWFSVGILMYSFWIKIISKNS